jgi:hypothetical protein
MGDFDQFADDETRYETMSLSIRGIVVDEQVISVLSSFWQAFQGFFVRVGNRGEGDRLPSVTHSDQEAPDIQIRVFSGNESYFRGVTCIPGALQ